MTTDMDDWGAAMAEQAASENADSTTMDDWSAALNEQSQEDALADNSALAAQNATASVFEEFTNEEAGQTHRNMDFIMDIPVQMTVELGRTKIPIKNLLQLAQGSVVELDGLAGEPMDVFVNGCLIAQGEVVVVNEKFGIRLTDVISPSERIRKLNK